MEIIAHRGLWFNEAEKNTLESFVGALENGFGIETDFRDFNGALVISHDLPDENSIDVTEFINLYKKYANNAPIALNIKSDGLQMLINEMVEEANFKNFFVFDMSIPDMKGYIKHKLPVFTRLSEYEKIPAFYDKCDGVWLDSFENEWYNEIIIREILENKKKITIVSPELHGRNYQSLWELLKSSDVYKHHLMSICTDYPLEAKEFFNVKN